jgi:4-aminobutyrate aminotransferase-like enzyme/Ser/Thr protein kinase RdoA (MazF antagonist)
MSPQEPEPHGSEAIDEATASGLALSLYGLRSKARALPGEYDANFHLACDDGTERVLKIMHPARDRGLIELQYRMLEHLARRDPGLVLPRLCTSAAGEPIETIRHGEALSPRLVWMLSYVPGPTLASARPRTLEMLESLGQLLGRLDAGLWGFVDPAATRELKWDLGRAGWIRDQLGALADPARRALVERFLAVYEREVIPALPGLRRSVIHGDANDHNVIIAPARDEPRRVVSLVDFGDAHHGITVSEVAIGAAYALLGQDKPLAAAAAVVRGYHGVWPLEEREVALLFALIGTRLAVSVVNSARIKALVPGDPYVTVSETQAWDALDRLSGIHPRLAHYTFRESCGMPPVPDAHSIGGWLQGQSESASPVLGMHLGAGRSLVLDLGVGSTRLGADPAALETALLTRTIFAAMEEAAVRVGVGRYGEARLLYASELFGSGAGDAQERRTVHLGIDLFVAAGSPIQAPLSGVVHLVARNDAALDYGPLVILRHATEAGRDFFTLYGHLDGDVLGLLRPGQAVARGEPFARVGAPPANGGWPPHLHFQIILDLLELGSDFPGVAHASERAVWTSLSPDPSVLLSIPSERFPPPAPTAAESLSARRAHLGRNLSLSYRKPLKIVQGFMQYLYDDNGRAFLDAYNNVPLVGHGHPRVVRAVQAQLALLNTNTRYLHDNANRYAERLAALLPPPLRICFFLSSGSEANELALRLARAHTGREDVIVLEHAYHGNTSTLIEVSPYKFLGPGGRGRKPWVHVAPLPDGYRGRFRREDPQAGPKYAAAVGEIALSLHAAGRGPAAFLAETLPSVAGQIVPPPGYLAESYRRVRAAGGVCIADEVQTGFGRLGTHFWGFTAQDAVPDIVVLGKPIGNGFPLAAVVTTAEIAASFDDGMEFFSTFGGNPVACAAGLAVLDVLRDESLQERARDVGTALLAGFRALAEEHPVIGDVRGSGLFLGVELVSDRASREPATRQADYVVNRLRERGILTGTDGPHHNVLKLRPPLVFKQADAERLVRTLGEVLSEDGAEPGD